MQSGNILTSAVKLETPRLPSSPPPRVPPALPPSLSHYAAAASAPQLSRSTAQSHIETHALSTRTHTHALRRSLLQHPIRRSGFSSGIPSASSPGDGRCGSRLTEHSQRLSRVLLIGDAAGSLLLLHLPVQESSVNYISTGDLKWTKRLIRIYYYSEHFSFFGGGVKGVGIAVDVPLIRSVDAAVTDICIDHSRGLAFDKTQLDKVHNVLLLDRGINPTD
ncbi:unnamed protein product [Menidia menidia]|uniref:(Atlantic silverside) hypothetical protein n=1 Tax=Menidia menidia TaxID=238744 RepID=A0A8S4B6M6_9TELE|nr:unnamed protein product [Menidia menidia]